MKTGMLYFRKKIVFVVIAIFALALSGCPPKEEELPPDNPPPPRTLRSISITPTTPSMLVDTTTQLTATGTFSDGTKENMTSSVTWSSTATGVATVNGGLVTSLTVGAASIRATFVTVPPVLPATVVLNVKPPSTLRSIAVTPSSSTMRTGITTQFTATGTFSDGFTQATKDVTASSTWTSSSPSVATLASSTGLLTSVAVGTTTITATVGAISGTTSLQVSNLESLTVEPLNAEILTGTTQQFIAKAKFFNDLALQDITSTATWSSSNTTLATIGTSTGLGTATSSPNGFGFTTIKAVFQGRQATTPLKIIPATLLSISISPSNLSVVGGLTPQFTATGQFNNNNVAQSITGTVTWSSSNENTATISNVAETKGKATALSVQVPSTTIITATFGTITAQTTLTVLPGTLTGLSITPLNTTIARETKQQFIAEGTFSVGSVSLTFDVTPLVTWTSTATSTATIASSGIATAGSPVATTTTTIQALLGPIATSTSLTVTTAILDQISVAPVLPEAPLGVKKQFSATGIFTDKTTQDIALSVAWSSSQPVVATIDLASGLARGQAKGTTTITATATFGDTPRISGTTVLTVTDATLKSLSITPISPVILKGTAKQFKSIGVYSNGSAEDLTISVAWSSDNPFVASISPAGLATGVGGGTAVIKASFQGKDPSTELEVVTATLDAIIVRPASPGCTPAGISIPAGISCQYTAHGKYSNESVQDLTNVVLWGSTSPAIATINNVGLATAINTGTTTIVATFEGVSCGSACPVLTVNDAGIQGVLVTPAGATIGVTTTLQYKATASYNDGISTTSYNVTAFSVWSSTDGSKATVNASGLVRGTGAGGTSIVANFGGASGSTLLTVITLNLDRIDVTPSNPSIHAGQTQQFKAEAVFAGTTTKQDITDSVTWSSTNPAQVTISNVPESKGLATGVSQGSSTIIAVYGFTFGTTTLLVKTPVPTDILLGKDHTCVRLTNGSMFCWGGNASGQLGTDGTANIFEPQLLTSVGTRANLVAAGGAHTCASFTNGTVNCWGKNSDGQLGDGTKINASNPVRVKGVLGVTALTTGGSHTCAVFESGVVKCWGLNDSGQLGRGDNATSTTPVSVSGSLIFPSQITAGTSHTCALLGSNSGVQCWGNNSFGQLGNNTTNNSNVPISVFTISTAIAISAGGSHTCALLNGGAVQCWGKNDKGQLGNGAATSTTPVFVSGLTAIAIAISAGGSHTCALLSDAARTVQCWGDNSSGQLGNDSTVNSSSPVTVLSGVSSLAAGGSHTCATLLVGELRCWGENKFGQIGNGVRAISRNPIVVPGLTSTTSLGTGGAYTCAVSNATVLCLGNNEKGQLGDGTILPKNDPVTTGIVNASAVSVGRFHACALLTTSTGNVKCWGNNGQGRLGNGTTIDSSVPVDVNMTGLTATSTSAGGTHTCMLLLDKTVRCWGAGGLGQTGNGLFSDQADPVPVINLSSIDSISAGESHTCALNNTSGQIFCWGSNSSEQLGNDSVSGSSNTPVLVSGISAKAISAGDAHTCAILTDNKVSCWGSNNKGQLGDTATTTSSATPVSVTIFGTPVSITAGLTHTCVRLSDNSVVCWGDNSSGQLGNGGTTDSPTPGQVTELNLSHLTDVIAVSAGSDLNNGRGESHTCAIIVGGSVKCWGDGAFGQIGSNLILIERKPVTVLGLF